MSDGVMVEVVSVVVRFEVLIRVVVLIEVDVMFCVIVTVRVAVVWDDEAV
jgi:hypothetical protein